MFTELLADVMGGRGIFVDLVTALCDLITRGTVVSVVEGTCCDRRFRRSSRRRDRLFFENGLAR